MSTTEPVTPVGGASRGSLPPERRTLVALLAALEGLLLVAASVLSYLYRPQPVPVYGASGGVQTGWTLYGCPQPLAPGSQPTSGPYPYPCPTPDNSSLVAMMIAIACGVVALLVLPAVIGAFSRRWQTALAAPCIPIWLALLVLVAISLANYPGAYGGNVGGLTFGDFSMPALVFSLSGPLLSALAVAAALGGLGWLARRAFAR